MRESEAEPIDERETRVHTPLLVIGAGPYGLATAAYAKRLGIEQLVVGEPMAFWHESMPTRMFLRSGPDWHLDATGVHTFMAYLEERGINPTVVAAPGISHFTIVPEWVERCLSPERWSHTCHLVRFDHLRGKRCLIVGGRQSAFEWAALLAEEGAEDVHIVHRHDPPEFTASDWHFVDELMEHTLTVPGWFRYLPADEHEAIGRRFWAEGRLKLEPWLTSRLDKPSVHRWPHASVEACRESPDGEIEVELSNGTRLAVDYVILATGYKADMTKVPYLAGVIDRLELADGFPILDEHFQSSLEGLFITGFPATRDFGPFFGFVRGCPVAATLTTKGLTKVLNQPQV